MICALDILRYASCISDICLLNARYMLAIWLRYACDMLEICLISEGRESRSRLGLETESTETLGLVSVSLQFYGMVSSRSRLVRKILKSLVSVSSRG